MVGKKKNVIGTTNNDGLDYGYSGGAKRKRMQTKRVRRRRSRTRRTRRA